MSNQLFAEFHILNLLNDRKAMGRRCLQSHLHFDHDISPHRVTRALGRLVKAGEIMRNSWQDKRICFDTYALTDVSEAALNRCVNKILRGHAIQESARLGLNGQDYIRTMMMRSKVFDSVTQRGRLGNVRARNGSNFDIRAKLRIDPYSEIVVEVKNVYEDFPQRNLLFGKLVSTAVAQDALPILVASYVSDRAKELCEEIGVCVI